MHRVTCLTWLALASALVCGPALAAQPVDVAGANARLAPYRIQLKPSKRWTPDDLRHVVEGVESLPAFLRKSPRPLTLERSGRACLYGMGRYNSTCPTFSKDGATFYLYDVPAVQGEGATRKLRTLSRPERAQLVRRRGVIHALVALHDKQSEWSKQPRWRMINSWKGDTTPFNDDAWAFSRYMGSRSPHLDLVTFAEEYFARPEDVLKLTPEGRQRLETFDVNLSLACQQFTKIRYWDALVGAKAPTWVAPLRGRALKQKLTPDPKRVQPKVPFGPASECSEFERWADMSNVEGIDLVLAAATSDRPESLYGHLLLAVRYKSGESVRSQGFQPVYQYGAITATNVNKLEYFTKGLFGGFKSVIQPNTFRGVDRLFLQYEQRTLRRYGFNLSADELRRVMERIWEAERHITYSYYFFSDNCASMLIDLLAPAIDKSLPDPTKFGLMPTEVLDVFASVQTARGPLLVKRTETHFSSREVAANAITKRRTKLGRVVKRLGLDATQRKRVMALDKALDQRDPEARKKGYEAMQGVLVEALKTYYDAHPKDPRMGKGSITRDVIDYLYYSTRIERYFMDLAFYAKRMIYVGAHKQPLNLTAKQQLQMRRDLFKEENIMQRQEAMLAWAALTDERVRDAPRRDFTKGEQKKLEGIERTRAAYLQSLDALATVIETFEPEMDGVAYIDDKLAAFEAQQKRRDDLATGPPGKGRYVVGGSVAQGGTGLDVAPTGWLDLSVSTVYEQLGEQRRRGFRSDIESRALGLDAELLMGEGFLNNIFADLVLFKFMTIEQRTGPAKSSWRDSFGWGLNLHVMHDGRRGLDFGAHFDLGYVYPLWQKDNVANFLVAGLFVDTQIDWGRDESPNNLGLNARLLGQLHLYGRYANVMRFELGTTHLGSVSQGFDSVRYGWDVYGRLGTEHVLGEFNQQMLLLKPYIKAQMTNLNYRAGQDQFVQWKAGTMLELPF